MQTDNSMNINPFCKVNLKKYLPTNVFLKEFDKQHRTKGLYDLKNQKLGTPKNIVFEGAIDEIFKEVFGTQAYISSKHQKIKNLQLISSFRGRRHQLGLPVRGQRTHTNAKTRRKRKVV